MEYGIFQYWVGLGWENLEETDGVELENLLGLFFTMESHGNSRHRASSHLWRLMATLTGDAKTWKNLGVAIDKKK